MNMLDRVANELRALASPGTMSSSWENLSDNNRDCWRDEARKVMQAMTDPDDAMLEAGRCAIPLDTASEADADHVWTSMLHAALEGK